MTCKELKEKIESKSINQPFIIFVCDNLKFVAEQYCKEISTIIGKEIEYTQEIPQRTQTLDIFGMDLQESNTLRVLNIDSITKDINIDETLKDFIIITKKVDKEIESLYETFIVNIPVLEYWQIKDYSYSLLKGLDTKYIDWLIENCNYDIYRIDQEIKKICLFEENERNIIFRQMVEDNAFADISNQTIFNFIDSIMKKKIEPLHTIYEDIDYIDIEPLGVVTLLYNNVKKLIQVWLSNNPKPEDTGLSSKQIYAINKLPRVWTQKELIDLFKFLTNIDYQIKTGQMPMNILRDYVIVKMLAR